ncbi:MAG: type VI secretion system protein TssA [Planctomycetales bacterium]|nr:type VI secretion system protein TssA [Planctomycetales bacterium]MBN8626460.1 type VI secretion system protein TssA [Planctomycetota bacterium]
MKSLDLSSLLQPVSETAPSGENLEYDPQFSELERSAQGTAEQQYGATVIEAKEPEWSDVRKLAAELCERTHDLRVGLYVARANLHTSGLRGFREGLALLRGYVEQFWDTVHPQLDPDDDNDPTIRVNTLVGLCDINEVLTPLKKTPIVSSRTAGRFSRNDYGIASGELPFSGREDDKPKMSLIDAAFQDCSLDDLRADTQAVTDALSDVRDLEAAVTSRVGAGNMRSLEALTKELDVIRRILAERLARREPTVSATTSEPEADASQSSNSGRNGDAAGGTRTVIVKRTGDITSREEAITAIGDVCKYFERYEPSSPLPLLLHRAMRLSTKSFLEIMRDISPDGLSQAESLGGMSSDEYQRLVAAAASAPAPARSAAAETAPASSPQPVIQNNDY